MNAIWRSSIAGSFAVVLAAGLVCADGLESTGNTDSILTWHVGTIGPGQSHTEAAIFAFAPSHKALRALLDSARKELVGLPDPGKPTGKPEGVVWLRNKATDFALEANGAFFWEKWRRQSLACDKGGQLSRLSYYVHYNDGAAKRAGIPIGAAGHGAERLRVVEPTRACGAAEAVGTTETEDKALRIRYRARMGSGAVAACEYRLTNVGPRPLKDVRLSVYANLESRHSHPDDYSILDRELGGALVVDPSRFVLAMVGFRPPTTGYSGRWHSTAQLQAGSGIALAKWKALGKIPDLRKLARTSSHSGYAAAPRLPSAEPPTIALSPDEARRRLEDDWIFQAEGKPLHLRAAQEIGWALELAARLALHRRAPDLRADRAELDALARRCAELKAHKSPDKNAARELYLAVRRVKRRIALKSPAVDFDSVLLIDHPYPQGREWPHQARHRNGMMAVPGGRLIELKGLHPGGQVRKVAPMKPGSYWRPDLSFDAGKVLFCYKQNEERAFHLYEIGIDGTGVRQLTDGPFDDTDPIYLPDGHIMFTTTRCHTYVRCMPYTYSYVLARCDADGRNICLVSRNSEPDWCPALLNDGRVVYSRWEYTDKALWRIQSLWSTNPDGTNTVHFYGNQSVWPDHLTEARPIPGSDRVMFTGLAHHNWFNGAIGILDTGKGRNYPHGLTKVTFDVRWPESGDGPAERPESPRYHTAGPYDAYKSPYPISPHDFLVSARRGGKFRLYLMDLDGNRELIYDGVNHAWYAMPIKPRPRPIHQPDRVTWATRPDATPEPGIFYSPNVYEGVPDLPRGTAKHLRVIQSDYKTYTLWHRDYRFEGPAVSIIQSEAVKRILGTVPVETDGSVHFKAPAGVTIHFQLLDEHYRAVQTMRTFTGILPGERRGCVGCHELSGATPPNLASAALRREPSDITPPPWGQRSVSYERLVQPVLDKHCAKCHQGDGKARKKLDLTLRPGVSMFKEPYVSLIKRGIANAIMAENFGKHDPKAYATFRPLRHLSCKSRLIENAMSGKHHGVKVDPMSLRQLIGWVDANCPYRGDEDCRALEPRTCAKAPVIDRARDFLAQRIKPVHVDSEDDD